MTPFRVTGAALQVGPGDQLILSGAQVAARKHLVKEVRKSRKDQVQVEARALLTFKVGEVVYLREVPKQAEGFLVDLSGGPKDAPEETVKAARARAEAEQRAAAAGKKQSAAVRKQAAKAYEASAELQKQYPTLDAYIASLTEKK